jgi:hypothetical protein
MSIMHTDKHLVVSRALGVVLAGAFCLTAPAGRSLDARGGDALTFPEAPHPEAIGTDVGDIRTYVSSVTLPPPESIHRWGLHYLEIRGVIRGVGWGGMPVTLRCHYTYELPYVLRIPPAWSGGLVVFSQGAANLAVWEDLETMFGERSIGRIFHEQVDRHVSDVALHPSRRWAFFAVNYVGVSPGGRHNTILVGGEPGCAAGAATQAMVDVTVARNHALLARHLLKTLRGHEPSPVLGVGHGSGTVVNLLLNAGLEHRRSPTPIAAGDNHRTPYEPSSGRIFDGFLSTQGGFAMGLAPSANLAALSAPTIFLAGEADRGMTGTINQINEMTLQTALDPQSLARVYSVRNLPLVDEDLVLSLGRRGLTEDATPYQRGGGERLKPLTGALLDALALWTAAGIPPPPSIFNGEVKAGPDRIEFARTGPPITTLPYVDDDALDSYLQPPPIVTTGATAAASGLRTAWTTVRAALGATVGSVVLPETACRRGRFNFQGPGPIGTWFEPFSENEFVVQWGTQSAYQSCRVQAVDALAAAGLYDETVVTIDVQPGAFPNLVNARSLQPLQVAILSTAGFDATHIMPGSLRIASATASAPVGPANPGGTGTSVTDVNGDGRADLVVEFRLDRISLNPHDIVLDVWGSTRSGSVFTGADVVTIVP